MTFFWAISDFLSGKTRLMAITETMVEASDDHALVGLASDPAHPASGPALWMLLLLRLTKVTSDQRVELRNSRYPRCGWMAWLNIHQAPFKPSYALSTPTETA